MGLWWKEETSGVKKQQQEISGKRQQPHTRLGSAQQGGNGNRCRGDRKPQRGKGNHGQGGLPQASGSRQGHDHHCTCSIRGGIGKCNWKRQITSPPEIPTGPSSKWPLPSHGVNACSMLIATVFAQCALININASPPTLQVKAMGEWRNGTEQQDHVLRIQGHWRQQYPRSQAYSDTSMFHPHGCPFHAGPNECK